MRQGNYLNVVLTVIAVLLTALLWTNVANDPVLERAASASTTPPAAGVQNIAVRQREAMLEELRKVQESVERTRQAIESGSTQVEVVNLSDIEIQVDG